MRKSLLGVAAAVGLGVLASAGAAQATESIRLTIASSHPLVVPWIGFIKDVFMPTVDAELAKTGNYAIEWQEAFGGQLYKANATLSSVEEGITDIGWVFSYLEEAKLPLSQLALNTPFTISDAPILLDVMTELMDSFPAYRKEWEQHNLVFLGATAADNYDLYTKEPVSAIADLSGKKISAPGTLGKWLRGIDATAVDGALPTFYTDIQTGVSDGVLSIALGIRAIKAYEVAPYITIVNAGVAFSGGLAINRDTWDGLPEEVQAAMKVAGAEYSRRHGIDLMERHDAAIANMVELGKDQSPPVTVSKLADAERQKWIKNLPNLAAEWVEENEARGLPAKEFLLAYMKAIRARGVTPDRDWDQGL